MHISAILPSIITLVSKTFGGILFSETPFLDDFSLFKAVVNLLNLFILNKSSLLFKAILIPIYPINKYTNIPTIAVIIGRFINVPIPLTIKYAITKPTIRPIVANNISD